MMAYVTTQTKPTMKKHLLLKEGTHYATVTVLNGVNRGDEWNNCDVVEIRITDDGMLEFRINDQEGALDPEWYTQHNLDSGDYARLVAMLKG